MSTENVLNNCMLSYRKTSIESVHLADNAVKVDQFGRLKKTAIITISVAAILGGPGGQRTPHFPEWGVTYKAVTPRF